jgi:pimeloyl-ACP methyl ester carboxylesterase
MPHLDANGLRFHVQVLRDTAAPADPADPGGDGTTAAADDDRPKVVMLHGLVADNLSSYYYTLANPMALHADTYLYDLRGHGRSEVPKTGYAVVDHVADLRALLAAWDIHEPVHLVGNSFGCVVALTYAHLYPGRVASLVLIEGHFATEGWGEHMAGSLALAAFGLDEDGVRDWLERNGSRKLNRLARHSERLFLETSLIDELGLERPFPRQALAAIDCPVLAVYGEHSDLLDRAAELERHVPACELHVVPGCSHSVLFEATPLVRELVLGWIVRHARQPSGERGG